MKDIKLHNTLTGTKDVFSPIQKDQVKMYHCGPTLYGPQHIGNLSMFVFTDILRRALEYRGYDVAQVINFTDVGHLSGDNEGKADEGEDRMSKGLRAEGMELTLSNMRILAEKYAHLFFDDIKALNVKIDGTLFPYASDYIKEQIELIERLEKNGHTYTGELGVYFDTSTFPDYGKLGNINLGGLEEGARVEKSDKRNPTDFVLWKGDKEMGWESPWGRGFPGWHIECSAMIIKLLGEQIDIHTGGIEHIPVHHNNEIAQSEGATNKKPFSKFWLHRAHLKLDDSKISKSGGNTVYVKDFKLHSIHPLSFRYFLLMSQYQTPTNMTWESVAGAQTGFEHILRTYASLPDTDESDKTIIDRFEDVIYDNLNTPQAIALLQEAQSKHAMDTMDTILGLQIQELSASLFTTIPDDIIDLKRERDDARTQKDWQRSDDIRKDIEQAGFVVEDGQTASTVRKTLTLLAR